MSNTAGGFGGAVSPPTGPGARDFTLQMTKISLNCSTFQVSNLPILGPFYIIEMIQYFRLFDKNKVVTELSKVVSGNHLL